MTTSNTRTRKFSSTVGKIVIGLVFASMIGGISIAPAFARNGDGRARYSDHGRYEHGRYRTGPYYRDGRRYNRGYYRHGRGVYQYPRRYYSAPFYPPPPLLYGPGPYQSPGINFFFPLPIR